MKIGIDISQVVYQGSGIATYTSRLVESLLKVDKINKYVFFGSSLRQKKVLGSYISNLVAAPDFEKKIYSFPPLFLENLWNRLHIIKIENLIGKVDLFHSSDWLQPPTKAKKVTTIHDMIVYRYPESFSARGGHNIVENQKRRLKWVTAECDLIMADSIASKQDIVSFLKIPEEKVRVVYLAPDVTFKTQSQENIDRVKRKYNIRDKYILCVGAREPRKNFDSVIQAFSQYEKKYRDCDLVIAGKFGWGENSEKLKVKSKKLKILGYVPQEDLPALYSGASCFVYPSFYEGFGLPVLEAMACGCPVVTTNRGSLAEIAGKAAVLVDPKSVEDISAGIIKALSNQQNYREKGFAQSSKYNWEKTAQQTLAVYREATE